jgi:biotin synthase
VIKLSAGTAQVVGLKKLTTDAPPSTAYLMQGEKCTQDCGFCPQARTASSRADLLSRVTWAKGKQAEIIDGLSIAFAQGILKRACVQVIDGRSGLEQVRETVQIIKHNSDIPICVSAKLYSQEELLALAELGVDRIGLALDAACARVYNTTKTGSWAEALGQIQEAARLLPGRISTHLIVGLGETEEEMVTTLQTMQNLGVTVGLFAFTPVVGTKMALVKPPDIVQYRRIQVANLLISNNLIKRDNCNFSDSGQLMNYGLAKQQLKAVLQDGTAFQTSGCPDCNRPYYNEKPGGVIYNYPRPLYESEIQAAVELVLNSLVSEMRCP